MFRCQVTGKLSKPGEKSVKVVLTKRPRQYWNNLPEGDPDRKVIAEGWEIVEELTVSKETARLIAEGKLELRKK